MVPFRAKSWSQQYTVMKSTQELQPPMNTTYKIKKQGRMATWAENAEDKKPQINIVEISEKRNQNGTS